MAALALDLLFGEPPQPIHPTVWMGRWIAMGRALRRSDAPLPSFLHGAALVAAGGATTWRLARGLERIACRPPPFGRVLTEGAALKSALSLRALLSAAAQVERALAAGDSDQARRLLGWHLVSRDTSELTESEVAGAVIESLAENLSDGLVAPLLAYRAAGLPAAYLYRFVNTADSMLGYRTPELEWFGKTAARADDVLNWFPARLSACLIALAAPLAAGSPACAARVARADARRTPSPNAGWPMAAIAGALGVRLTKRQNYELNAAGRDPRTDDIRRASRVVSGAAALSLLLFAR